MSTRTYDSQNELHSFNDKPAKVYWEISEWYKHGKLHRDNDLPVIVTERGHREWWVNGKLHRDNGPAVIRTNGVRSWYRKGLHIETL